MATKDDKTEQPNWDDSDESTDSGSGSESEATHYRIFRCQLCGKPIGEGPKKKKTSTTAYAATCGHQVHKKCVEKKNTPVPGDCVVAGCRKKGKLDPETWRKLRGGTTEISKWDAEEKDSLREKLVNEIRQNTSLIERNEELLRSLSESPRAEAEQIRTELNCAKTEIEQLRLELAEVQQRAATLEQNAALLLANEGPRVWSVEELSEEAFAAEVERRGFETSLVRINREERDRRYRQFTEKIEENNMNFDEALQAIDRQRVFTQVDSARMMVLIDIDREALDREVRLSEVLDGISVLPSLAGIEYPTMQRMIELNRRLEQLEISYDDVFDVVNDEAERAHLEARKSLKKKETTKPAAKAVVEKPQKTEEKPSMSKEKRSSVPNTPDVNLDGIETDERAARGDLEERIQRILDSRSETAAVKTETAQDSENVVKKSVLEARVKDQECTPNTTQQPQPRYATPNTPASDSASRSQRSTSESRRRDTSTGDSSSKKTDVSSSSRGSRVSGVESIEKKRSSSSSSSSDSDSGSSESTPPKKSKKSKLSRKRAATKRKSTSKSKAPPKKKKVTATKKKPATKHKPATTKPAVKRKLPVAKDEKPEMPPEGVKTRSQTRSESKLVEEGEVTQSSQETLELAANASEFEEQPESRPPLPNVPAPEQPPPPSPERVLQDQQPGLAQLTPCERAQRAFQEREREFRRNMEIALRHHDREAARVREGRMDLGPIEDYFEPLENCPPPPAPVWLMAEFRYEPRGERYVRGMFFPVTRDTIQQSMQSRGILINNDLTVRDDLYYQRDGGAWILGRVYRGGATYYVINSFVVIGDALAHAVVSEVIYQNVAARRAWSVHPLAGSRIPTTTMCRNLRSLIQRAPQRVVMSAGQFCMESQTFEIVTERILELWRALHRRGTRHILMVPPLTWPHCPEIRVRLRDFLRQGPTRAEFDGRYVYMEALEETIERCPPATFRGETPYLNEHQASEALVRIFEYATVERRWGYGQFPREQAPPRPVEQLQANQLQRIEEMLRQDRAALAEYERRNVRERLEREVHERELIERVQRQMRHLPGIDRQLLPERAAQLVNEANRQMPEPPKQPQAGPSRQQPAQEGRQLQVAIPRAPGLAGFGRGRSRLAERRERMRLEAQEERQNPQNEQNQNDGREAR
ncbi:uncharacterized protein LOC135832535 isoform X2 [Planococcus citri]|uniref:uncharacterized protein LOC135832535 isoform X2 n=1 Tax=Planococcus citri TaxID=170843 RepID=UPI0031F9C5BE